MIADKGSHTGFQIELPENGGSPIGKEGDSYV